MVVIAEFDELLVLYDLKSPMNASTESHAKTLKGKLVGLVVLIHLPEKQLATNTPRQVRGFSLHWSSDGTSFRMS